MAHSDTDNRDLRHEESDVNVRAILGFVAALLVLAVVIHVAVWLFFVYLDSSPTAGSARRPMAAGQELRVPPEPRLQQTPRADLENFRANEEQLLNGYQWVDRDAGIVRIPIGEAMKLAVQRGLPARPAGENAK